MDHLPVPLPFLNRASFLTALSLAVAGLVAAGCPTVPSARLADPDPEEDPEDEDEGQGVNGPSSDEGGETGDTRSLPAKPRQPRLKPGLHRLTEETLPTGPSAQAQPGDWVLVSGSGFRFVLSDLDHRVGFHESGGKLIDLAPHGGEDVFDGMSTWLERSFPRQGRYDTLSEEKGTLVASGRDSGNEAIAVETRWSLSPTQATDPALWGHLRVTTTVTNQSDTPLPDYDLGDLIGWGGLRHFAPGPGFALRGEHKQLPWIGGEGEHYAALLVGDGNTQDGPHGSSWSDPVFASVHLKAGQSHSYVRHLLVGPTLAVLVPTALDLLGQTSVPLEVEVTEEGSKKPIAGAEVRILDLNRDKRPFLVGRTDASGGLLTAAPPGTYQAVASSPSRSPRNDAKAGRLATREGGPRAKVSLQLSAEGQLLLEAVNGDGKSIAARFSFERLNGEGPPAGPARAVPENRPDFGSDSKAIGGHRVHIRGRRVVALPPGRYRIVASAGPASAIDETTVTVDPSLPQRWEAKLPRLIQVEGWMQCDLHQHSQYSPDSSVLATDGLLASAAEGLDCIATTEHDAVQDWTEHLEEAGLPDPILWLPGIEVTSPKQGHYNSYPWPVAEGTVEHRGLQAAEILQEMRRRAPSAVLQVNHPRLDEIGLFNVVGLDLLTELPNQDAAPAYDFDVLEILNGKRVEPARGILEDWMALLDAGRVTTAVGTSDSHRLVGQERGLSRTWIQVGEEASADGVVEALRRTRRATASTGPFVDVELRDGRIEVVAQAPAWMPLDRLRILQGPPGTNGNRTFASLRPGEGVEERVEGGLRVWRGSLEPNRGTAGLPAPRYVLVVAESEAMMEPWMDCPAFAITNPVWLGPPPAGAAR